MIFLRVDPSIAGELDITIPALFIASIFVSAEPEIPSTMAPAWPIRLPGGAVRPAINPIMGLPFLFFLINSAASSYADPPISPIIIIASVFGSE